MAGSYAKIFNEIWADPDFRSLTRGQQWLFFALISQPELNFAGVVTTTDRRLTGCAEGFTVAELRDDLAALQARDYIVVDEEHDEILVRTYIFHDGAWRTPNVLKSIIRDASVVRSQAIRATLAQEMSRLKTDDLSGVKAEEMRTQITRVIETLKPRVPARVSRTVSACVSEPFTEGITESIAEPTVVVAVVVEEVEDRTSLSLFTDLPPTAGTAKPSPEAEAAKPSKHEKADQLTTAWWERYKSSTAQSFIAVRGIIRTALSNGLDRDNVARALDQLGREGRAISGGSIQTALAQINGSRPGANGRPSNGSGSQIDRSIPLPTSVKDL